MNRLPELKTFVKFGGAESFENVEIEFVSGQKAILTIFKDGIEQEQVALQSIATEAEMHQLMLDKGFVLRPPEELAVIQERTKAERQKELELAAKREAGSNYQNP